MMPAPQNHADDQTPKSGDGPVPAELLMAFADGELDSRQQTAVERWLQQHPEAVAEVEALRELDRLWQETPVPDPDTTSWAVTLDAIHREARTARRQARWTALLGALGAAAVCLALLTWPYRGQHNVSELAAVSSAEPPWPVVTVEDIDILSIDGRDHDALVVGVPPVPEPLVLATADEIRLSHVGPTEDGRFPMSMPVINDITRPMIVAPGRDE